MWIWKKNVIAGADNAYEIILIREKVLSLPNFLIEMTDFASLLDVLLIGHHRL